MFILSLLMLGSIRALQATHMHHHRHCLDETDVESAAAGLPSPMVLSRNANKAGKLSKPRRRRVRAFSRLQRHAIWPVASTLRFHLLGTPQMLRDGAPLNLSSSKGQAMLFYLAVTRRAQPRVALAHLLWSEMPDQKARTNLRVTLSKLRSTVGEWLDITREAVTWRPEAAVWTDVAAFEEACAREERASWETAVSFYRGDFLQNFTISNAPAFEEWVLLEQERLRQLMHDALYQLVILALGNPDLTNEGIGYARRLLVLDPWRDEAHRHLMQLLVRDGRRSEALAQFETCRRILAEEPGVQPAMETVALYEAIRDDEVTGGQGDRVAKEDATLSHNLPASTTPFIGRETELAQIADLMANPDCRLLTLIGPGGIGKTRLALAAAQQAVAEMAATFTDGIFFVGLAAYRQGDYEMAVTLQQRSADLYRQTGPRKDLATVLNNLGLSLLVRGQYDVASATLRESAAVADEIGYHACLVVATQNLGLVAMRQKTWDTAEPHLTNSLQLAQKLNVQDMAGHIHADLCQLYLRMGKLTQARQHGLAALALGEQLGIRWLVAAAQGDLADVALAEGRLDETETRLRAGLALALELAAQALQLSMLASWAALLAARNDPEAALRILAVVIPLLNDDPDRLETAEALLTDLRPRLADSHWQANWTAAATYSLDSLAKTVLASDSLTR